MTPYPNGHEHEVQAYTLLSAGARTFGVSDWCTSVGAEGADTLFRAISYQKDCPTNPPRMGRMAEEEAFLNEDQVQTFVPQKIVSRRNVSLSSIYPMARRASQLLRRCIKLKSSKHIYSIC